MKTFYCLAGLRDRDGVMHREAMPRKSEKGAWEALDQMSRREWEGERWERVKRGLSKL